MLTALLPMSVEDYVAPDSRHQTGVLFGARVGALGGSGEPRAGDAAPFALGAFVLLRTPGARLGVVVVGLCGVVAFKAREHLSGRAGVGVAGGIVGKQRLRVALGAAGVDRLGHGHHRGDAHGFASLGLCAIHVSGVGGHGEGRDVERLLGLGGHRAAGFRCCGTGRN